MISRQRNREMGDKNMTGMGAKKRKRGGEEQASYRQSAVAKVTEKTVTFEDRQFKRTDTRG